MINSLNYDFDYKLIRNDDDIGKYLLSPLNNLLINSGVKIMEHKYLPVLDEFIVLNDWNCYNNKENSVTDIFYLNSIISHSKYFYDCKCNNDITYKLYNNSIQDMFYQELNMIEKAKKKLNNIIVNNYFPTGEIYYNEKEYIIEFCLWFNIFGNKKYGEIK